MYAYLPTFLQNFTLGRILSRFYDFFELTGRLLPCETLMSAKQAVNDKLQGSAATYLRCGGVVKRLKGCAFRLIC